MSLVLDKFNNYVKNGMDSCRTILLRVCKNLYPDLDVTNHWNDNFVECLSKDKRFNMEMYSPRCINKVPHEGIVIRNESLNIDVYKLKCFAFLEKERAALDKGEFDIEAEQ